MNTEVSCIVRKITATQIAVADGTEETGKDARHGGDRPRERWFWLPISQVTVEPEEYSIGQAVVVTMPEWLATDRGLI